MLAVSKDWPLNIAQLDFDLLKDIRANKKIPLQIKWNKGHQDDDIDYQNLYSWAKNNVQANTMAKLYWIIAKKLANDSRIKNLVMKDGLIITTLANDPGSQKGTLRRTI
jgi:hypothetical protein